MAREKREAKRRSCCPLTGSSQARETAEALASSIKDAFPDGLARPALRALAGAGLQRLDELTDLREGELLSLHGMGPKAVKTLRQALLAKGLSFRK